MPRKTDEDARLPTDLVSVASMRPRPDAAENSVEAVRGVCGSRIASMRPRPDAAENVSDRAKKTLPPVVLQ